MPKVGNKFFISGIKNKFWLQKRNVKSLNSSNLHIHIVLNIQIQWLKMSIRSSGHKQLTLPSHLLLDSPPFLFLVKSVCLVASWFSNTNISLSTSSTQLEMWRTWNCIAWICKLFTFRNAFLHWGFILRFNLLYTYNMFHILFFLDMCLLWLLLNEMSWCFSPWMNSVLWAWVVTFLPLFLRLGKMNQLFIVIKDMLTLLAMH